MLRDPTETGNPLPAERSFQFVHSFGSKWGYHVHAHPCYELIHIQGGYGTSTVGDATQSFHPGDLFLVAPGLPHTFFTDGFLPDGQTLEMRLLWFMPALVDPEPIGEFAILTPLLARARRGVRFRGRAADEVGQTLLAGKMRDNSLESIGLIYGILERLNGDTSGELLADHETSAQFRGEEMARLDAIRHIIRKQSRQPLTLDHVAREAGISASTLNHLLRKYSRTTFLQQLTFNRMEDARRMLRESDDDITGIAFQSGFGSLATFNRRFRALDGMSPTQYRQQHR